MKAELLAHFCLTYPAYRTARPGMLCRPTKVAAANCHALLPESSHLGDGTSIAYPPFSTLRQTSQLGTQLWGRMSGPSEVEGQKPCHSGPQVGILRAAMGPQRGTVLFPDALALDPQRLHSPAQNRTPTSSTPRVWVVLVPFGPKIRPGVVLVVPTW